MKIRLIKTQTTHQIFDAIEIKKEDYPELNGMSDNEALEYLNDNMYDIALVNGEENCIYDEFFFGKEIIREKITNETSELKAD